MIIQLFPVTGATKQDALDNAEVVEIEGQDYPAHPHAYFPLVRFYRGTLLKRVALGARQFEQLHVDFKQSMAAYVSGIPAGQTRARSTGHGIVLTVNAVRPANLKLGWREEMLEIEVDLVWRTADGRPRRAGCRAKRTVCHHEQAALCL